MCQWHARCDLFPKARAMFYNYFKLALRRLLNRKGYSIINLLGLTAGLVACLFIFLYVQDEMHFDKFHQDHERIFRVTTMETEEGLSRHKANAYAPLADLLETGFPGAKQIARYFPYNASVKNPSNNALYQEAEFFFADSLFFEIFDFQFLAGDQTTALNQPNSIVLSEPTARRYFGDSNPMGQTLLAEGETEFIVTGIVVPPPGHSTLQFDLIASYKSARSIFGYAFDDSQRGGWYYPPVFTFVKFPDVQAKATMEDGLANFTKKYLPERLHDRYQFQLQPLAEIHFTALEDDLQPSMKMSLLKVLMAVALLILGIACANYVNINLSVLLKRFREIGVRRVMGAAKGQLLSQMAMETYLFLFLSFFVALAIVQLGLPAFNTLIGKELSLLNTAPVLWVGLAGLLLILGLLISILPYLASLRPDLTDLLKNKLSKAVGRKSGSLSFKDSFIVFQFAGAAALLIATVVILQQLNFIKGKDIGFEKEQVMIIPIRDDFMQNNFAAAKRSFSAIPGVEAISAISNFPWQMGYYDFPCTLTGQGKNISSNLPTLLVDQDFVEAMQMDMVDGRSFSYTSNSDSIPAFILNQAACERFGITSTEGMRMTMTGAGHTPTEGEVVGILKDFNMQSLHHQTGPLAITIARQSYFLDNFVMRLETGDLKKTIAAISEQWEAIAPERPFDYFFLDETFDQLYRRESRTGVLFSWFTGLALLIACLGMFALAAILCEQRIKEIGIRKVLGASTAKLVGLLSKDFLKLVIIALVVASPLAYFFMEKWLTDFAYRIDIQWWVFIAVGAIALVVAFLTVGFQSARAALANPVESLRSE